MKLQDRFLKYVKYDTQSSENSDTFPSTLKQHLLGEELVNELKTNKFNDLAKHIENINGESN